MKRCITRILGVLSLIVLMALAMGGCASDLSGPDAKGASDSSGPGAKDDASLAGLSVGSACAEDSECSGVNPLCIIDDLRPLSSFENSSSEVAQILGEIAVVNLPDGYCSNEAPCTSDADCGRGGACFAPLVDVDLAEYESLVDDTLSILSAEEKDTLVEFHQYGQCLQPCNSDADCTRPGYVCGVPLENFVMLVESMGGRMETYCVGEPVNFEED